MSGSRSKTLPQIKQDRAAQIHEWLGPVQRLKLKVTCGGCNKKINFWAMIQCLYCGFFFCRKCARAHFKSNNLDRREDHD